MTDDDRFAKFFIGRLFEEYRRRRTGSDES